MAQPDRNFNAMRQDAIRRSREMQRRANHRQPVPPEAPLPAPPPPASAPPECELPKSPPETSIGGLLSSLHLSDELHSLLTDWDGEKLALAGLLYLLWKEGNDPVLLLALAYILL